MGQDDRLATFRSLHESGCFVIPNPWDAGSAVALASLGFRALATSSAAVSFIQARAEAPNSVSLAETLENVRAVAQATPLPVNADFQAGYSSTPEGVGENVRLCVDAGAAGISIEDMSDDPNRPLFELQEALDRVRAARSAIDATGRSVLLTARCESFLVDHPRPLETAIERLVAFADAGADCLYAPGLRTPDEVHRVVEAVSPKPVNVLACELDWMTVPALGELGVRRISVGSALARAAWGGFLGAATEIAQAGTFGALARAESFENLNKLFISWERRSS